MNEDPTMTTMKFYTTDAPRFISAEPGRGKMRVLAAEAQPKSAPTQPARVFAGFGLIDTSRAKPLSADDAVQAARGKAEAERIAKVEARNRDAWKSPTKGAA